MDDVVAKIAVSHGVAFRTILLRWSLDQDVVPITTTTNIDRMDDYIEVLKLTLTSEEREEITRIGWIHHFRFWVRRYFDADDRS